MPHPTGELAALPKFLGRLESGEMFMVVKIVGRVSSLGKSN
jgi:hypothetical protein